MKNVIGTQFVAIALFLGVTVTSPTEAELCPGPAPDHTAPCDPVAMEGCWIQLDGPEENVPWLVPLNGLDEKIHHRAFCSGANDPDPNDGLDEGRWFSYGVYEPPSYEEYDDATDDIQIEFPVVYYLHGQNGLNPVLPNAVARRFDRRLREGRVEPALYFFPNGGCDVANSGNCAPWVSRWVDAGQDPPSGNDGCEFPSAEINCFRAESALWELFSHVETEYSVTRERAGWGLEGFSAGGAKVLHLGLRSASSDTVKYPVPAPFEREDAFGSIVALSGSLNTTAAEKPGEDVLDYEDPCSDRDPPCNTIPKSPLFDDLLASDPEDFETGALRIMVKYGEIDDDSRLECDVDADQTAELNIEVLDYVKLAAPSTYEPDSRELVIPKCGEDNASETPLGAPANEDICTSLPDDDDPCALGHDSLRMQVLRGNEIIDFHQANYWRLPGLEYYQLHPGSGCPEPDGFTPNGTLEDDYLVGDWNGDGCATVAAVEDGVVTFDASEVGVLGSIDVGTAYTDIVSLRAGGSGRSTIVTTEAVCDGGGSGIWVTSYGPPLAPNTEVQTTTSCIDTTLGDDLLAGDFGSITDARTFGPSDWREDLAIRRGRDVEWYPQIAWGFETELLSTNTTRFGKLSDVEPNGPGIYVAGYWGARRWIAADRFDTTNTVKLRDRLTQRGERVWEADIRAKIRSQDGGVLTVQAPEQNETHTVSGGFPFDAEAYGRPVFVEARVDPTGSQTTSIGFSSSATGRHWNDGQLIARLDTAENRVRVRSDGFTNALGSFDLPDPVDGYWRITLGYDPVGATWSLYINGETFEESAALGSFVPDAAYAGFQFQNAYEFLPKIDDFRVFAQRSDLAGLALGRPTGSSVNYLINYDLDGQHNEVQTGLSSNPDQELAADFDGDGTSELAERDCDLVTVIESSDTVIVGDGDC